MWERFSYYGMRALLVLYLVNGIDMPREEALKLYATYTAFVYLTPVLGGYLADRWLGAQQSVLVGGIVMAMGHFAMAFQTSLYLGLVLLVMGNGFFKPNISTMVGQLYSSDDPRRDGGFTLFYMGINLGAFFSPLICGTLGEKWGWHYGFGAASVGMLLGVLIFSLGLRRLALRHHHQTFKFDHRGRLKLIAMSLTCLLLAYAGIYVWPFIEMGWQWMTNWQRSVFIGALLFVPFSQHYFNTSCQRLSVEEKRHILAIFILGLFVVFFWMGFEQAGGTMNLFALEQTNRVFFGWEMPASVFQSINPLLIFLLAPLFSIVFVWMDRSKKGLATPTKMAFGMIILGLGFVVLAFADAHSGVVGKVSPLWLLLVYFLFTVGELFLSPIGLSMVTRLAPMRLASLMMGLWFTAVAIANYLAGTLEAMLEGSGIPLYWFLVSSSMGAGLLLLLVTPLLKRLMAQTANRAL
jgi:POT family proton-dependent oligopeptide transporter